MIYESVGSPANRREALTAPTFRQVEAAIAAQVREVQHQLLDRIVVHFECGSNREPLAMLEETENDAAARRRAIALDQPKRAPGVHRRAGPRVLQSSACRLKNVSGLLALHAARLWM